MALLLTLGVVAVGLSLAATEGRDERDVLVAVGARPRTLRRLAAQRALAMTALAAALAIPTGYLPAAVVIRQAEGDWPTFPWLTAAGLLGAVPLIAAGAAWVVSAIAQRVRPPGMSTLIFE